MYLMIPSLAVLNQYLYGKKEFLACSSTIKQVCIPVWEAAFFTFVSGVLVGGFIPLKMTLVKNDKGEF